MPESEAGYLPGNAASDAANFCPIPAGIGAAVVIGVIGKLKKISGNHPPINWHRQRIHTDGTQGKSQFKSNVDVEKVVEDAWRNGEPQFNSKGEFIGKVKQYNDEIGTQGQKSVDVRFSSEKGVHGFPSNKVE
ncbi:MAG: hypothetical protein HOP23_09765 [Methylococcaceae bacterium]|nr:hypothetical protein [Methylococcaceae bacterium]